MNHHFGKIRIPTWVSLLFLSLNLFVLPSSGNLACSQGDIQSVAPLNTTIVSVTAQSDPVAYCDVLGYVTPTHPGPNQVNFVRAVTRLTAIAEFVWSRMSMTTPVPLPRTSVIDGVLVENGKQIRAIFESATLPNGASLGS